jgi:hypothetical protein
MEMEKQVISQEIKQRQDSLEIGTPSKGGAVKVYFDCDDTEEAKKLITNAMELRDFGEKLYSLAKSKE